MCIRDRYQDQVDQINEVFINFVAEGRDMPVEDVRALATGLTFTGMDAVENGLADELGTQEAAVAKACELAGIADADTVYLQSSTSDLSRLLDIMGTEDSLDVSGTLKELELSLIHISTTAPPRWSSRATPRPSCTSLTAWAAASAAWPIFAR